MAKPLRGAEVLVRTLAQAGVDTIFALSGNQIMSVFDACIDADIDIVHTRHEGAAVYMAEAYAQVSGKPGVALVTAGAGVGNATGALFSASESDTPVLLISGDSPTHLDGRGAFQELDQVAITSAVTRWSHRVADSTELPDDLAKAFEVAQTPRPGPVHLAIPVDTLMHPCATGDGHSTVFRAAANSDDVTTMVTALSRAAKPLIITGPSLNPTRQPGLLQQLKNVFQAPVVAMESPRGLNDPSLGNFKSIINEADVVVSLGKRVDFSVAYGDDFNGEWLGAFGSALLAGQAARNLSGKLVHSVVGDPLVIANQLTMNTALVSEHRDWNNRVKHALELRLTEQGLLLTGQGDSNGVSPVDLCRQVQVAIDRCVEPVLVCDGGEFGQWAQACLTAPCRVINGLSGSIGGGIGYGVGAAKARCESTVFVMTGDGSAGFHLAEIETAVRNGVSIIIVVGNDSRWNAEYQLQIREFGADRVSACELSDISYHDTCVALGGDGEKVHTVSELSAALARFNAGVMCLDVTLDGLAAPTFSASEPD